MQVSDRPHNDWGLLSSDGTLSPSERLAVARLTPFLGPIERLDVPGTDGACDFVVVEGTHAGAVVEATDVLHSGRRELREVLRGREAISIQSAWRWTAYLYPKARVKTVEQSKELLEALIVAERAGVSQLPDYRLAAENELMASLGIEMLIAHPSTERDSSVLHLAGGGTIGSAWTGKNVDLWLPEALESAQAHSKRLKLSRSGAEERHLYLGLDLDVPAGRGIELMLGASPLVLPTVELPEDITDLWLWPEGPSQGLYRSQTSGWQVVSEHSEVTAQFWTRRSP